MAAFWAGRGPGNGQNDHQDAAINGVNGGDSGPERTQQCSPYITDSSHKWRKWQDSGPAGGPRNGQNGNQDPIINGINCRVLGLHGLWEIPDGRPDPIINGINCRFRSQILAQMVGNVGFSWKSS